MSGRDIYVLVVWVQVLHTSEMFGQFGRIDDTNDHEEEAPAKREPDCVLKDKKSIEYHY